MGPTPREFAFLYEFPDNGDAAGLRAHCENHGLTLAEYLQLTGALYASHFHSVSLVFMTM